MESSYENVGRLLLLFLMAFLAIVACHWRQLHSSLNDDDGGASGELVADLLGSGLRNIRTATISDKGQHHGKVSVEIYVESLCIDSKHYMEEQVLPAYQALGRNIMNLSVISFGNAKFTTSSNHDELLSCQHGAAECDVNSYQQCASFVYDDDVSRYLPFLACLFETLPMGHRDDVFSPATIAACTGSLHWPFLKKCHDNPALALELQKTAAAATPAEHTYVPWVVIDGLHVDEAKEDLVEMICAAYNKRASSSTSVCPPA